MRVRVKVAFKLFHNDQADASLVLEAKINRVGVITTGELERIPGSPVPPEWVDACAVVPTVKRHVREWMKDTQYCILFDPEGGIESRVQALD